MSRVVRDKRSWLVALGLAVVAGVIVPLLVMGSGQEPFTATPYADVIRFEAQGVASLQVQIFDLSGRRLWDSGIVSGRTVDWNRANMWGERLAYGAYLYQAMGWNARGAVVFQKTGKLALMPGDKVQLQTAPSLGGGSEGAFAPDKESTSAAPLAYNQVGDWTVSGKLGIGTDSPPHMLSIVGEAANNTARAMLQSGAGNIQSFFQAFTGGIFFSANGYYTNVWNQINPSRSTLIFQVRPDVDAIFAERVPAGGTGSPVGSPLMWILGSGQVGIGTKTPTGKTHIVNTSDQPTLRLEASAGTNLIEAYNTGSGSATGLIFRVERATGDVRADGAFYGAGFYTGSADVAEHISVSESVEPGDVVEIDPLNPQHFRKAQSPVSRLVAGVISTSPGVVLGSNSDPVEGEGDPRPVLALAGRVPVKVTTENGPIAVGDLLVSSSRPGYAMRSNDPVAAVGAVVGKALEPLEAKDGVILAQVMLR